MASNSSPRENTVIYKLFPDINGDDINCNLSVNEKLEICAEKYVNKISGFLSRYLWQNDSFNLHVTETATLPHLEGITSFEDNVDDEWFIVYLMFYLSNIDKNLVIQIQDEDGEFLLIEAAEHLPKWLNPDTSENRIFIHQGSLHIIPVARGPADVTPLPTGTPTLSNAVSVIRKFSSSTKASDLVQESVKKRISSYPHRIDEFKHKAHCYVPCSVAALLKEDPHLVSAAVKAFYLRDPIEMKACNAMKFFAPETRVMTEVVFTRCLYAQLSSQDYEPDKRTGWNLSNCTNSEIKAHKLGMKLACGFEILASNAEKIMLVDDEKCEHDFCNDVRWKRFLKSLQDKGYFRNEIEGTQLYQRLFRQAQDFYLSSLQKDSHSTIQHPGVRINKLLQVISPNYEEMKEAEKDLPPPDDDSWMDITPEMLDSMLERMSNQPKEMAETITGGLKTFLHEQSGVEGVEPPSIHPKNKKQKINFDAEAFTDSVNKILDFRIPDLSDDGSSSSMSGYSDNEEEDVVLNEGATKKMNCDSKGKEKLEEMQAYIDQMDRELAKTNIGLSFEKILPPTTANETNKSKAPLADSDIDCEEEDSFQPVDIDLNALKNILESYSSQQGMPGPISSLFASMGVQLPDNSDS